MQTVILPGFSPKNKTWLNECASNLGIDGIVRPVSWDHWLDPEQKFDAKEKGMLISRHSRGDSMNIIAKSIGTLVASYVVESIPAQIRRVILTGIPIKDLSALDKQQFIKGISFLGPEKLICFQNDLDPHGSFIEVRDFLPETIKLVQKPRTDHEYPYYEEFNEFLA